MRIDIIVDSRPSAWGPTCTAALATRAAETLARWVGEALQETYHDAEVRTSAHDYTEGESTHLVSVSGVGADVDVWERVHDLAEQVSESRWQEALASVLPKRRGRKPAAQPKRRTGVTLPPELHEWLHAQPNLSSVVQAALEEWRARHEQGEGE